MNFYGLIVKTAESYLVLQNKDGSFNPGHNGPWYNKETSIRNTAHISFILYKAYRITKKKKFLDATKKSCDYIMLDKNRPYGKNFFSRYHKDEVNGLIGPAWAIEPLIFIGRDLKEKRYLKFAETIILLHKFNKKRKLWHICNLDGSKGIIDETLNHQLWFAAMALSIGKICKNSKIIEDSISFFLGLRNNITFVKPGLIEHNFKRKNFKYLLKKPLIYFYEWCHGNFNFIFKRSRGYLSFNTQAFSIAYKNHPEFSFWKDIKIKKIIRSSLKYLIKEYPLDINEGPKALNWAYNPTGFEVAYSLQTLGSYVGLKISDLDLNKWLSSQIRYYYDFKSNMMSKNTCDPKTQAARFYEAIDLKNLIIKPLLS